MDDKTTILTKIGLYIFIENKINLCFSALCACLLYLFYKQDLTYTIICFIGLFSVFCLLKEFVSFCKRKITQSCEAREKQLEDYQNIEELMKNAVIQILNNEYNIELFKQGLNKTTFLSNEDNSYGLFISLNNLIGAYNLYEFNDYEVLDIDNIDGGIEFRVKSNIVPYIRTFFKKHKNDYMKFVLTKHPNDDIRTNEEDENCEETTSSGKNKNEDIKAMIKEAIVEANAEMQKPQIVEYEKIPTKDKFKRIFYLIFCQKKLDGNPDLPFAMLQMLSGDMLSVFKWFLYIVAGVFGLAFLSGVINFSVQELSAYALLLGITIMALLIGKILNKTKDVILKYQYDKSITLGLFSAFIAILSLVIALISLLK